MEGSRSLSRIGYQKFKVRLEIIEKNRLVSIKILMNFIDQIIRELSYAN